MNKMDFLLFGTSAIVSSFVISELSTTFAVNFDNSSQANFVNSIAPYAKKLGAEKDLYASIMIAQATLESGSGASTLAKNANNLFGVKEKGDGPFYELPSKEYKDGQEYYEVSKFKKFDTQLASLEYYTGHFTQTPWYTNLYKGIHRSESTSYQEALKTLDGKYATDPLYIQKLQTLIDRYNLTQYDVAPIIEKPIEKEVVVEIPKEEHSTPSIKEPVAPKGHYIVKKGDSLYQISKTFGIPLYELLEWNGLSSELVNPGITLIVDKNYAPIKKASTTYDKNGNLIHTILKGESINTLIRLYNIKESDVLSWNSISKSNFYVGQQLIVKKTSTPKPTTSNATYTAVKGDTLYGISKKTNISVDKLMSLNNLSNTNIKVGQKLIISSSTSSNTTNNKTSSNTTNNNTTPQKTTTTVVKNVTYKVVKGDTLNKIAKKYNTNVAKIKSLNNLKNDAIKIGQNLIVSQTTSTSTTTVSKSSTTNPVVVTPSNTTKTAVTSSSTTYKVVKGDTLNKIAKKYNTTVAKIKSLNNLKNDAIKIGQNLKVK